MRRFGIFKHESTLVLRFLVYPDDKWENHVDVLKNSEKIHSMHLRSLYGNLKIFEEKVVLRKVIRKDSFKDKSSTLLTEKDDGKCLNYGGTCHFAHDCKIKKNSPNDESYEEKYKRLVASLKRQNHESKFLVAEEEELVDVEELSDEEVKKDVCLMVGTGEFVIDENSSNSTTNGVDLVKLLVIQNFRTEIPHPCIRLKNL